jgi:hypothetical protein
MPRPQPDAHPDGSWPSCDDQQPGVSIRPLRHADLAALLAHLEQHDRQDPRDTLGSGAPAPVVAMRVRAGVGRPGAPPQPNTGATEPPNEPAGPTACPGGWPQC